MSRSHIACALAAAAALASLAGCSPNFEALTVPPPSKTAELDDEERTISVSKGVALAFECTYESKPCVSPEAKTDDLGIASVLPAYVDALSPAVTGSQGRTAGAKPRSVFVVLGLKEGKTTLSVTTDDGDADFDVEVVP